MRRNANKWVRLLFGASVASIALSVCLCVGSTFAWFQHSLSNESTIQIGTFNVRATIGVAESKAKNATALSAADTILLPGAYDLSVRGTGNTPGYALIFLEAATSDFRKDAYYTPQLNNSTGYTYRIVLHEPTAVRVTPVWGKMEGDNPLKKDAIIWYGRPPVTKPPAEEETTVPSEEQTDNVTDTPLAENTQTVQPAAGVEKAPVSVEKVPVSIEKAPVSVEKAPVSVEKAPVSIEKAPASIEKAPVSIEKAPVSAEKIPASVDSTEKASASIEKAPVSVAETPAAVSAGGTSTPGEAPE